MPETITLVPLPPYSPELNPVERSGSTRAVRFLSHRVLDGYPALLEAACRAWNALAETRRLAKPHQLPYLIGSELI